MYFCVQNGELYIMYKSKINYKIYFRFNIIMVTCI